MGLFRNLLQDPESDYQVKFFNYILLVAAVATVVGAVAGVFYITEKSIMISNLVMALLMLVFYFLGRYKNKHTIVVPLTLIAVYIHIGIQWFMTEGINGYTVVFFSLIIGVPYMVIKKKWYIGYTIFVAFYIALLIFANYYLSDWFSEYPDSISKEIDRTISIAIASALSAGILMYFKSVIDKQKLQLQERNNDLQQVNKQLESFANKAAHDLKSPIIASLNMIQLAKESDDLSQAKKYIDLEESSLRDLNKFINEMLELSKSTQREIKKEHVDIEALFEKTKEKLKYMDSDPTIQFKFESNMETSMIPTDRLKLEIIFNNILSNAIRYQDLSKEKPFLNLALTQNGEKYTFEFKDNGIGIDKEILPKIFNPFFKGSNNPDSTGLGLHSVNEAVKSLGGKIEARSEQGKGTTFVITLPKESD